jgi:hypothetical protein
MPMRTSEEFALVKQLAAAGLSDYGIAEATGISRDTLQRWRHRHDPPWTAGRSRRAAEMGYR